MERGLLAEFETPEGLVAALRFLRSAGYRELDAFVPHPVPAVEEALELPRPRLPRVAFAAGALGGAGGYLLQLWCNGRDYPLDVGGRPLHSALAFVPIAFELAILGAALATVAGIAWSAGFGSLWRPVFEVPGFESATVDRFWAAVSGADPTYRGLETARALEDMGARRVVSFGPPWGEEREP